MTRRPKRSGISYIEDDNSRSLTFFKRRAGLFKTAADLSTLTGAKIAIAIESESGKMSSFGTPSPDPIIDSFLSGNIPVDPFVNDEEKAKITFLQNELFKVEKEKYEEDKRSKETLGSSKEIQESSRKAKFVYGKIKDLSVEQLNELLHDILEIKKEVNDRLHPQQRSYKLEDGGSRDPSLQWLSSSSSHSHILLPPKRPLPWTAIQHNNLMPQHSSTLQPQAQAMLSLNEAYQHSYNTQGLHINGNISQPFSQSSLVSALPPPPPSPSVQFTFYNEFPQSSSQQRPTPLPTEAELNLPEQPQNLANTHDFTTGHPFANQQWPSPILSNEPYYDTSLCGHNFYLGDHGDYGGQTVAGEHDMPRPSVLHQQASDCPLQDLLRVFLRRMSWQ